MYILRLMNSNYNIYSEKLYETRKEAKTKTRELDGSGYVLVKLIWDQHQKRMRERIVSSRAPLQRICESRRIFVGLGFRDIRVLEPTHQRICKSPRIDFSTMQLLD